MKRTILIIIALIFSFATSFAQNDTIIKSGFVNIATLVVDFETYAFEGGHLGYYECPGCSTDTMQYYVDYLPAGDFGGISFTLNPEQDTFFDGTIVWAGQGQIYYPAEFSLSPPFNFENEVVPEPGNIKFLGLDGNKIEEDSWLYELKDPVWDAVDSLKITQLFAAEDFSAVVYFYAPSVGILNPAVAKWVVFLYYADQSSSTDLPFEPNLQVFPNPVTDKMTISVDSYHPSSTWQLMDLSGRVIYHGILKESNLQIDLTTLQSGLYYLVINDQTSRPTSTIPIVKR